MPRVLTRVFACAVALGLAVGSAIAAGQHGRDRSMVGTLQRVEGKILTLLTARGLETLAISPSATIHVGSKTMRLSDLASRTGSRIKVRYTESRGQKQAQSITVPAVKQVPRTT